MTLRNHAGHPVHHGKGLYVFDLSDLNLVPSATLAANFNLLPAQAGVYMIFFDSGTLFLERSGYLDFSGDYPPSQDGFDLLYVGATCDSLRVRARQHVIGNSRASSLRMTVGAILAEELTLEPVGDASRTYFDFGDGEGRLTAWLCANTCVAYRECQEPFAVERELLRTYPIPLNIVERRRHAFSRYLMALRAVYAGRPRSQHRPFKLSPADALSVQRTTELNRAANNCRVAIN